VEAEAHVVILVVFTAFSLAVGYSIPRRSGIWIAALAVPLAEWLGLTRTATSPQSLLVLPAAFCALSAYAGVLIRRRTNAAHYN
jgi:hypothetical protein